MTLDVVDGLGATRFGPAVWELYARVFGPQDEQRWRDEVWERHRDRPDYRLATAVDDGDLVGFAWGYTGLAGQYWTDRMDAALGAEGRTWIGGHFEFVELGVDKSARGRGVGGLIHDALLRGLPHQAAVLCTATDGDNPALPLYRSRGWVTIGRLSEDVQIMGLRSPGTRTDARIRQPDDR